MLKINKQQDKNNSQKKKLLVSKLNLNSSNSKNLFEQLKILIKEYTYLSYSAIALTIFISAFGIDYFTGAKVTTMIYNLINSFSKKNKVDKLEEKTNLIKYKAQIMQEIKKIIISGDEQKISFVSNLLINKAILGEDTEIRKELKETVEEITKIEEVEEELTSREIREEAKLDKDYKINSDKIEKDGIKFSKSTSTVNKDELVCNKTDLVVKLNEYNNKEEALIEKIELAKNAVDAIGTLSKDSSNENQDYGNKDELEIKKRDLKLELTKLVAELMDNSKSLANANLGRVKTIYSEVANLKKEKAKKEEKKEEEKSDAEKEEINKLKEQILGLEKEALKIFTYTPTITEYKKHQKLTEDYDAKLNQDAISLSLSISDKKTEITEISNKIRLAELNELNNEYSKLSSELTELTTNNSEENESLKKEIMELDNKINQLNTNETETATKLKQTEKEYKDQLDALKFDIINKKADNKRKKETLLATKSKLETYLSQIGKIMEIIREFKVEKLNEDSIDKIIESFTKNFSKLIETLKSMLTNDKKINDAIPALNEELVIDYIYNKSQNKKQNK